VQDGVYFVWVIALTRQTLQPDSIREQQVVKRAVKAAEEDTDMKSIGSVRQIKRCRLQPCVGPLIVSS
jgi:hypothetical protein